MGKTESTRLALAGSSVGAAALAGPVLQSGQDYEAYTVRSQFAF